MIQNILAKILLAPFAFLYGVGVSFHDFLYRKDLLKGEEFDLPVISIGNLSVGGAGKTPHIEYLIRLLKDYINVATLSRGYKRKTKGYILVNPSHDAETVGDEPLQFSRKFDDIMVAVAENRTFAIPKLLMEKPDLHVVLLDDAFQHRSITPGLNVLLTEFDHPFTQDYLLPVGRLREWKSAYTRANIIVVSKCPFQITPEDRERLLLEIKPTPRQKMFFSYYHYDTPYGLLQPDQQVELDDSLDVLLICAIARTDYLTDFLEDKVKDVKTLEYEDHHYFSKFDVSNLKRIYDNMVGTKKVIITTEKDAMRLELHRPFLEANQMPIFVLPIKVAFHDNDGPAFDQVVKDFLLNFRN